MRVEQKRIEYKGSDIQKRKTNKNPVAVKARRCPLPLPIPICS
jgi:hypothetical protein